MTAYQFEMWNRKFVVDTESGNFFEVDELASTIVSLLPYHSEDKIISMIGQKYARQKIVQTLQDLSSLKQEGLLFSSNAAACERVSRKITDLTLNLVNDCNLSCRYCWNERGSYGTPDKKIRRMDEKILNQAINILLKESKEADDLVIDFYGGEPLLNFELIKKTIELCNNISREKEITFRFLLATNGTLMDKEKGEYLIKNGVDVAISLDGNKTIQDKQRPFPDNTGSFDSIMANLNSLPKEYRKKMVGRATFTPYSQNIIETFNFLRSLGFERIEVCESEKAGYGLDSGSEFFFSGDNGIKNLKKLYNELALFYTAEIIQGTLTYENTYFNRFFKQLSRLYHIHSIIGSCSAGFTLMSVDVDGTIYPCTAFIGIPQFQIGHVEQGIDDEKLGSFTNDKTITNQNNCNTCWAKRICRGCGSCYNLNYFSNNNLHRPDAYHCELFRYKTKLMIAMIAEISEKNRKRLEEVLIPEYYITRGRQTAPLLL